MENQIKLDPEFKAKWVAALRSGEYKQGRMSLRNRDGYCCLGVACLVAGVDDTEIEEYDEFIVSRHAARRPVLHPLMGDGEYPIPANLSKMNDSENKTFIDIADYIEQNY